MTRELTEGPQGRGTRTLPGRKRRHPDRWKVGQTVGAKEREHRLGCKFFNGVFLWSPMTLGCFLPNQSGTWGRRHNQRVLEESLMQGLLTGMGARSQGNMRDVGTHTGGQLRHHLCCCGRGLRKGLSTEEFSCWGEASTGSLPCPPTKTSRDPGAPQTQTDEKGGTGGSC